jgi:hypothetical protein
MNVTARRPKHLLALLAMGVMAAVLPAFLAPLDAATKVDEDKLYYGDARKYSRPAVVEAAKVYKQIPAHQELLDRKLTRDDPDYWPLMRKASQAFVRALRKVCKDKRHDLVGEVRSITTDGAPPPDITAEVIKALDKKDLAQAPPAPPRKKDAPAPRPKDPGEGAQVNADVPSNHK